MASTGTKEVEREVPTIIRVYKDGSIERLVDSPYVPPSLDEDPQSKDVTISANPTILARLYLPKPAQPTAKFPILVFFHGGAFCIESAFSSRHQNFFRVLAVESQLLVVSVEYRRAPENPLPTAYEDCWEALQWVASHSLKNGGGEPWILDHGDFNRLSIGGDSAGGNIVHNIALRAGSEKLRGDVRISSAFLGYPYFWGSEPIGNEKREDHSISLGRMIWDFAYPSAPYGIDNPMINPGSPAAEPGALSRLGCSRMLVLVAGKDWLRDRGVWYVDLVRKSGWKGEIELIEFEEEDHWFHVYNLQTHNAQIMIKRLASFFNK